MATASPGTTARHGGSRSRPSCLPDHGRPTGNDEALPLAREAAAFYNAFFLDYDEGAVYFNVLANGIPYLLGTERQKGSHSMAGYHSFELAYLATVYTNLLITKEPMDLCFSPCPGGLKDGILRVSPDILRRAASGSGGRGGRRAIRRLRRRRADGEGPRGQEAGQDPGPRGAHGRPVRGSHKMDGDVAEMTLTGKLDTSTFPVFQAEVESTLAKKPSRLVLYLSSSSRWPMSASGAAVRPSADGHQRPGRHLRRGPECRRPRGADAPTRTRKTSTSSRATSRSRTSDKLRKRPNKPPAP